MYLAVDFYFFLFMILPAQFYLILHVGNAGGAHSMFAESSSCLQLVAMNTCCLLLSVESILYLQQLESVECQ